MSEDSSIWAILTGIGSVAATAMVARSVYREYLPNEIQDFLFSGFQWIIGRFTNQFTMVIDEEDRYVANEIYQAAETYLGDLVSSSTRTLKIIKAEKEKSFDFKMEENDELVDVFNGVQMKWIWLNKTEPETPWTSVFSSSGRKSERSFRLTFHQIYKDMVINSYMPFLLEQAKVKKHEKKTLKLFTLDDRSWMDINLDHPANFDTLAMDSELKDMILKDLDRFLERRDYYRKVGKAWKRGYLLYGPPGTGKSSLIAAMANYLKFNIYDLDLTAVNKNLDLRRLLVATANKSILVVEDIDCTVELKERATTGDQTTTGNEKMTDVFEECESRWSRGRSGNQMTLSGFLNFIDGLWSSCGDERIIIFTTNHKDKLDPALLRPGRMDVHIHMSYCTSSGFRILATNYLGLNDHPLFDEIEELIKTTEVTPAEVAEQLLHHDDTEENLKGLIGFLHKKQNENENEGKVKKV